MKVLLLGYYGYRNIGDDLFVENLLRYLSPISRKVRVICQEKYYENRFSDRANIEFLCSEELSKFSRALAIMDSDVVAWGGGTLELDQEPRSLILTRKLSKLLGKKFGFLGVGLEGSNLQDVQLAQPTRNLFSASDFLYLRDSSSYQFATQELASASNLINFGGDLAYLKLDLYEPFIKKIKSTVIKNLSFTGKHWWGEGRAEFYARQLLPLVEKYNTCIHLLPGSMNTQQGDNIFHEKLKSLLPEKNCVLHTWQNPEDFLSILGRMDLHIGNRLHSIITADILGVPNLGISSDPPKIKSYIRKTSLLEEERVSEFMEELSVERLEKVHQEYERPAKFIEEESASAQKCLSQIGLS